MTLAQQLNELATANSEGLLTDDEYRILRQNLFEQHSSSVLVPTEAPIVSLNRLVVPATSPRRGPAADPHVQFPHPSPARPRASVASSVATLLRRATGWGAPIMGHAHPVNPPTAAHKHRSVIPRILQRKGGEPPSINTTHSFKGSPGRKSHSKSEVSLHHPPSTSSSHSTQRFASVSSATKPDAPTNTTNRSTFDDDDLNTAKDIRNAIMILETEGRRLIDAFDDLEERTAARIKQQTARRLPANTPENLTVLIDGSDWRERRPPLLPDPPKSPRRIRRYPSDSIDRSSIRSGSSIGTTLSQSRSVASLSQASKPGSPLSSRFPHRPISIRRKNSVSSLGVTTSSLSRSTGHLPLSMLAEHEGMQSSDTLPMPKPELDEDAEIMDIRKRRAEVVARYGTRLEYLKARLKGAELHEKLLRK